MKRALVITVATFAMGLISAQSRVVAQESGSDTPRIVGSWSGKTEGDGVLTLTVFPAPGREIKYQFSGGKQESGSGTFTLKGANRLIFTPENARSKDDVETWLYTFDEFGRLHLEMEEDNVADRETYVLGRLGQ